MKTKRQLKFENHIIEKSTTNNFDQAKNEWSFVRLKYKEENKCICGQSIVHQFILKNLYNHNIVVVGSTCAHKFLDIEIGVHFTASLTKLMKNKYAIVSRSILSFLFEKDLITEKELDDYNNKKWDTVKSVNEKLLVEIGADVDTFYTVSEDELKDEIKKNIQKLITIAENGKNKFLKSFAPSVADQFQLKGSLSKKQLEIVNKYVLE